MASENGTMHVEQADEMYKSNKEDTAQQRATL